MRNAVTGEKQDLEQPELGLIAGMSLYLVERTRMLEISVTARTRTRNSCNDYNNHPEA